VQKFTRPLTREIELAGARLALTLNEQGISVRPVGSRRTPWEIPWGAMVCHLTGQPLQDRANPSAEEVTAAVESLKKPGPSKPAVPAAPPAPAAPATPAPPAADQQTPAAPLTAQPAPSAEKVTRQPTGARQAAPRTEIDTVLVRLEHWLAAHRRGYHQGLLPGASDDELDRAQAALGIPLPDDLRTLLRWHNGQGSEVNGHLENNWDLMSAGQIVTAKGELDAGDPTQTGWQRAWIPFLQDDADDYLVLDTSQPGAPVREFWQGKTEHPVVAPSLSAWLAQFVTAVENGEYHEDPERGTFLHSRQ
jgi:cell wall assembly regulator SMI1